VKIISSVYCYIRRTLWISAVSFAFLIAFAFRRLHGPSTGPRLLRWYFQTCGAGFVKLGQMLAMRYDFLPAAYCHELAHLLDRLPKLPTEVILKVIEDDLGHPWHVYFQHFDSDPVGCASVAQVHQAQLLNGEKVVVKVMRPGAKQRFRIDFLNASLLAYLIDRIGPFKSINATGLVKELIRLSEEEFDFRREARSAQLLHELMEQDEIDHYAPKVYFSLSGNFIITMERLEGLWMHELLSAIQAQDYKQLKVWSLRGIDPKRVARLLLRSTLIQVFRHRVFHADPHAANLLVLEGGTLGYVDFGMTGWLDERLWAKQLKLANYIAEEKIHAAYEAILDMLQPLSQRHLTDFEIEMKALIREWILVSKSPYATISEKSSSSFLLRVFNVIRRARLSLPVAVMRLYRTIIIVDIIMLKVDPELDWGTELREFAREEMRYQWESLMTQQRALNLIKTTCIALVNSPQLVYHLLEWASHKVPELAHEYKVTYNRFERAILLVLKYCRVATLLLALATVGGYLLAPRFFPSSFWAIFIEKLGSSWWLLSGAALLATLLLGQLIAQFEAPE